MERALFDLEFEDWEEFTKECKSHVRRNDMKNMMKVNMLSLVTEQG